MAAEIALWALVRGLRPRFQWLITRADISPPIDPNLVAKHAKGGFDPDLGWVRKPDTEGIDETTDGPKSFRIDNRGCRYNPGFDGRSSQVAVFGDSYAFCRLVGDGETWAHRLSQQLGTNVRNFGVGNYGLDQALLRLERELPDLDSTVVLMAVVPETIARIHSYWKHYFEYGNILAFKPRFTIEDGSLRLHPPAIRHPRDYQDYQSKIAMIRSLDPFYSAKFLPDLSTFPVLPRVLAAGRHGAILWRLCMGALSGRWQDGWRRAFEIVLRYNARHVARLYRDDNARALLTALAKRFCQRCEKSGRRGVLVILPQPVDLEKQSRGQDDYRVFFRSLERILPVIDLTDIFLAKGDWHQFFIEGRLGPHLNSKGNALVAEALAPSVRRAMMLVESRVVACS